MKVVIIDDDPEIVETLSLLFFLRWPQVEVLSADEGITGLSLIQTESPDIVILDIGLPDINGLEVCRRIRLFSTVPVVMLTVKDAEFDTARGLALGADDYITKPFSNMELLARVKAVVRRCAMPELKKEREAVTVGRVRIDFATHEVSVDGTVVKLTPIEYDLLEILSSTPRRVIPHRMLLEKVWGSKYVDECTYLKVHVQRLRAKLKDDPAAHESILSKRGVGYQLGRVMPDLVGSPK